MRESHVETYLKNKVKAKGGYCWKLRFISRIGAPDRIILLPKRHLLIELKAPKKGAASHQIRIHKLLRWAGFEVHVIDSLELVDALFK